MAYNRFAPGQLDLFEQPDDGSSRKSNWLDPDHNRDLEEPRDPELIEPIRKTLHRTLAEVRALTDKLPGGGGISEAMHVEWSFRSRCGFLPPQEAYELRCAFVAEMARLYDAVDEWPPYARFPPVPPKSP